MQELRKKEKIKIEDDLNGNVRKRRQASKKVNGSWDFGKTNAREKNLQLNKKI